MKTQFLVKLAIILPLLLLIVFYFPTDKTASVISNQNSQNLANSETVWEDVSKGKNNLKNQNDLDNQLIEQEDLKIDTEELEEAAAVDQALNDLQSEIATELEKQAQVNKQISEKNNQQNSGKQSAEDNQDEDSDFITFNQQDFNELSRESSGNNNNLNNANGIIGGVSRSTGLANQAEENSESDEPESTAEAFNKLPDVRGQARGFNMLYLMHPRARETVERQVEALEVSGIRELYLSVLTDGTFSQDFDYLRNVIRRLNNVADNLTLVLYFTNGPTMRDFESPINIAFNAIDPSRFRDLIQFNQSVRDEYKSMVELVKPVFEYNRSLNLANRNIAIVMLEDNLTNTAYKSMRDLAEEVLGTTLVEYYRNPCEGCFPGNEVDPQGDKLEVHSTNDLLKIGLGDAFTNDGQTYRFPEEPGQAITLKNLEQAMLAAQRRGSSYFGIWREERQGLKTGEERLHPDERNFEVPTTQQLIAEVNMLRSGLIEIDE